uniref:Vacuolar protein sorting-associated protein 13B-like n=1 Tax=Castor canadensis TaxID=51338 RepID=A0A8B7V209_CASCN|nr:vacuolar protein sorting-associated protein 13B-like [Castor canadensis]
MQQQPVVAVPLVMPVNRRKEDELSVGSAPLLKQQSYQASEYASSPVKPKTVTESRPLSIPVKAMLNMPEGCRSPEERMKEFIGIVWNAVKSLTLQHLIFVTCHAGVKETNLKYSVVVCSFPMIACLLQVQLYLVTFLEQ